LLKSRHMYRPQTVYTKLALDAVIAKLTSNNVITGNRALLPELMEKQACFVSLHLSDHSLRGCIGTIEPVKDSLYQEIIRNAEAACTQDSRFNPVDESEIDSLLISVDVLSVPEKIHSIKELDPLKYGVIVSDRNRRKGVLLPALDGVETVEKQFNIVRRKAGLGNYRVDELELFRFTSTRYH